LPSYFADTSAIAKLYATETGSTWLRSLDLSGLVVSALAVPEFSSLIARREREGVLSRTEADLVWRGLQSDLRSWIVVNLTKTVLTRAVSVLRNRSVPVALRTPDALQLASALEAQRRARLSGASPLILLTGDDRLQAAARSFGFATDNPNRH
jgi:predicted nucleic acid-binding protein